MKRDFLNRLCVGSMLLLTGLSAEAQVTFEPELGLSTLTSGAYIQNNFYWNQYGVKFEFKDQNGVISPARLADIGGSATAFGTSVFTPNIYPGCQGTPASLSDYPYNTNVDFGCWFITDDLTPGGYPQTLLIDYNPSQQNTQYASGYIMDVDGSEGWEVNVYTNGNLNTPEISRQILGPGWHSNSNNTSSCPQCDYDPQLVMPPTVMWNNDPTKLVSAASGNGDGEARFWEVNTLYPIDRVEIEYLGYPNNAGVGVAFDGLGGVSLCKVNSAFQWAVDGNDPAKIHFTDQSLAGSNETIVSRIWTVNGKTYTESQLSYIFAAPGVYQVCLEVTATDAKGACCSDTYCEAITVAGSNNACAMDPGFDFSCFSGNDCFLQFNGSANNSTRSVKSWYWDFGDGTTSNQQNPIHFYQGSGLYEVCLTIVGDDAGPCCYETVCKSVMFNCNGVTTTSTCNNAAFVSTAVQPIQNPEQGAYGQMDEQHATGSQPVISNTNSALKLLPNPANETTQLQFFLDESANVTLSVIDMVGSLRSVILDGKTMEKGAHNLEINVGELQSGAYLLKLDVNGKSQSIKMLVNH